ncbi:MAG: polyprenyl diphosphate synthase [Halobacteriales archaeon]|nr:polyprenyl diphosphate synthase [Halobacteriales archaeon]
MAVIQDGNRRHALSKGEEPTKGHEEGAETTEAVLDWAYEIGVEEMTLYAFSTENFGRDDEELEDLFDIIADKLDELAESEKIHDRRVRVRGIGDLGRLPERVRDALERVEEATEEYHSYRLNIALAYGGREEIVETARRVARDVEDGVLSPEDVDASAVSSRLRLDSDVDLVVRTGGERRLSNFVPWQARGAGAEVYFCDAYWPRFERHEFLKAVSSYTGDEDEEGERRRVVGSGGRAPVPKVKSEVEEPAD